MSIDAAVISALRVSLDAVMGFALALLLRRDGKVRSALRVSGDDMMGTWIIQCICCRRIERSKFGELPLSRVGQGFLPGIPIVQYDLTLYTIRCKICAR